MTPHPASNQKPDVVEADVSPATLDATDAGPVKSRGARQPLFHSTRTACSVPRLAHQGVAPGEAVRITPPFELVPRRP